MKKSARFLGLCTAVVAAVALSLVERAAIAAPKVGSNTGAMVVTCPMYIIAKRLIVPQAHAKHVSIKLGLIVVAGVDANASLTLESASKPSFVSTKTRRVPPNTGFIIPTLRRHTTYHLIVRQNPQHDAPKLCPNTMPVDLGSFST